MKRLLILLLLMAAPIAKGQGFFFNVDPPAPDATIRVCPMTSIGPTTNPCVVTAPIFNDQALTIPARNPVGLGPDGHYAFWIAAGQYFIQYTGAQNRTIVFTLGGGGGGPGGFPRLDQVLNQNQNKLFDQGSSTIGFTNGPGLNLNGETSPLGIPSIAGCTTTAPGDFCLNSTTNNYTGNNGSQNIFGIFPSTVTSGDVTGFLKVGNTFTLQDLGSVNATTGNTFINAQLTNIQEGDSLCFDSGTSQFVNCTEGVPVRVITGTTYAFDGTERGEFLIFTNAGTKAVTIGQASNSTVFNGNFFSFIKNDGAGLLTLTAATSTFFQNGTTSITIGQGVGCSILSDPSGSGTYYTRCGNMPATAGSGITLTPAAYSLAFAAATSTVHHGLSLTIGTPGGTALSAASTTTDYITVPFGCTITAYNLAIDAGTITVKFWKVATGTAIPTSGNSINTSGVGISSGTAIHSTTLSDFTTTTITANDILAMNVTAASGVAFVNGVLACSE